MWRSLSISVALAAMIVVAGPAASVEAASGNVLVIVSGDVTLAPGFSVRVGAQAFGPATALAGQGFDTPFHGVATATPGIPGATPGECVYPLSGNLSGNVVTLTGTVAHSSNPAFVGVGVEVEAHTSTQGITFTFDTGAIIGGPFVLVGTGTVVVANSN